MNRAETIERVRERGAPWDVIVIGGGATGAGCAVDAATRGLSVLLLEQHDFGKGTSSRSTKLVHGGVRYLRQGDISMVREALEERGALLRNAPHVVEKQEFVVPCYSTWQKLFYGVGLKAYDILAGKWSIGGSRMIGKAETLRRLPNIDAKGLRGGVIYQDGRFDDTRLLLDLIRTAAENGAAVFNYARVDSFISDDQGKLSGVVFSDVESGQQITAAARSVINATGVFCDSVRKLSEDNAKPMITYAQGIHLVFDGRFLGSSDAIMIPKTSDGRVLFCIPWHGKVLVGTTDTEVDSPTLEPAALDAEIDFVLETAGKYLAEKPTRDDTLSVFAGIRPLVKTGEGKKTSSLSRSHDLFVDEHGLVTITGGKWTTYRRMAEDAVNKAANIAGVDARPCITKTLAISDIGQRDVNGEPIDKGLGLYESDVVRAIRDEMARTVEDVLARRSRALFVDAQAAIDAAPAVAKIMAAELGKDEKWIDEQLEDFNKVARGYQVR